MTNQNKPDVIVLCGGKGSRLGELGKTCPKALLPLNGQPILDHILNSLHQQHYSRLVICIGHQGEKIVERYRSWPFGQIEFSDAGVTASMLERIYQARTKCGDRTLVCYGDTLTNINLNDLLEYHIDKKATVTIVAASIQSPFGLLDIDSQGYASFFSEKPILKYYIGYFLFEYSAFQDITIEMREKPDGQGLITWFQKFIEQRKLSVYLHDKLHLTFNTSTERDFAEKQFINFYTNRDIPKYEAH